MLKPEQDFDSYYEGLNQWRQSRDKDRGAQQDFRNDLAARRQAFQEHKWNNPRPKAAGKPKAGKPGGNSSSPAPSSSGQGPPAAGVTGTAGGILTPAPASNIDPNATFGGKTVGDKPDKSKLEEWRANQAPPSSSAPPPSASPSAASPPPPVAAPPDTSKTDVTPVVDPNAAFGGKTVQDMSAVPAPEQSDKQWKKEVKDRKQQAADVMNPKNVQDLEQKESPNQELPAFAKEKEPYDLGLKPMGGGDTTPADEKTPTDKLKAVSESFKPSEGAYEVPKGKNEREINRAALNGGSTPAQAAFRKDRLQAGLHAMRNAQKQELDKHGDKNRAYRNARVVQGQVHEAYTKAAKKGVGPSQMEAHFRQNHPNIADHLFGSTSTKKSANMLKSWRTNRG
jgi:hypothetical protein